MGYSNQNMGRIFIYFWWFFALVINLFETPCFIFRSLELVLLLSHTILFAMASSGLLLAMVHGNRRILWPINNDIEMKLFQPPHYLPGGWQIFWIPAKDPLKATIIIRKWVRDAEKVLRKDPEYKDRMPR